MDNYEILKKFIFNDEIQRLFEKINRNVLDYNILDITGLGNQEIRHSNILSWLFSDSEHNLEYKILENFLKKVIEINDIENLQEYIYLSRYKKDIVVYREKDNIDILIVDTTNKVVIAIENKIFAGERIDGEDGGQLKKYENIINSKYSEDYTKYFIFLTIDLSEPSQINWFVASYEMLVGVLTEILDMKDISVKTRIIIESYIDTLKRNGIVEDKKLKELCLQIWDNLEYKRALEILNNYKPDIFSQISEYLQLYIEKDYSDILRYSKESSKTYISFYDKSLFSTNKIDIDYNILSYQFENRESGLFLKLIIGPSENVESREKIFKIAQDNSIFSPSKTLSKKYSQILSKPIISKDEINEKNFDDLKIIIDSKLNIFFKENGDFYKIREILNNI